MGNSADNSVARVQTKDTELVTGVWENNRIGTFRGIREAKAEYAALVFGTKGIVYAPEKGGYTPLLVEICKFFRTGKPPVSARETLEIFAFMEAADESKRNGGTPVSLESVMKKAQEQAAAAPSAAP